ncbi:hypothetical protein HYW32_02065 [Candidatus Berkelbacteria bacterium]|nr:hypothetical protein [Candidatus Berkelbacteria bacterium]
MDEAHIFIKMIKDTINDYIILPGRVPRLSLEEIRAMLRVSRLPISNLTLTSDIIRVKTPRVLDTEWFDALGGAVKLGQVEAITSSNLASVLVALAKVLKKPGRTLGVSILHSKLSPQKIGLGLKKLKLIHAFKLPARGALISAAQAKSCTEEVLILGEAQSAVIILIQANQDIDAFTKRDRALPRIDVKRGMLPPKLARIMVNLGRGLVSNQAQPFVLDPCVGAGRILIEARLVGAQILGADSDPQALQDTRANLSWLSKEYHLSLPGEYLIQARVEKLSEALSSQSVDLIITEPFLGAPRRSLPSLEEQNRILTKLEPLFTNLLRAGQKILKSQAGAVIVFPAFQTLSLLDRFIDKFSRFGYHMVDSFRVKRSNQIIGRDIVRLIYGT